MKKFLAWLIIIVLLAGGAFFALGNDMFMINLITQNRIKAAQDIEEELSGYRHAGSYNFSVVESAVNGEDTLSNVVTIKMIHSSTESSLVAHSVLTTVESGVETVVERNFYYKEGYLYVDNLTETTKTKEEKGYGNSLDDIFTYADILFFPDTNIEEDFGDYTFSSGFKFSTSPFYVGQQYNYSTEDALMGTIMLNFKFDMLRNYRGIYYSFGTETENYSIDTNVFGYNNISALTFPADLDTYVV